MDTGLRTFTKAMIWQVIGVAVTLALGWWLTGSASVGGTIAVANMFISLTVYVAYERLWERISWGRRQADG